MRLLAIGDIHGHLASLDALLSFAHVSDDDEIVFLGDYVDKGPDVKGVIGRLLEISEIRNAIFLRGNHDQMLINAYRNPSAYPIWECLAGDAPLQSYGIEQGVEVFDKIPISHWEFLEQTCQNYFETPKYIFVHAGIRPDRAPENEEPERLQWTTLAAAAPHESGRTVVCGHSRQPNGAIADLGHTICIDTGISKNGWLSCLDLTSFEYWQVDPSGGRRKGRLRE